jgi:hypothetical protein
MPKVDWGIPAGTVDGWDRDSQFKPYDGPTPPNGVYLWRIKKLTFSAATDEKLPQLRIGLELAPRTKEEKRYGGYFLMLFRSISDKNPMFWVPFLDAIGVSESDFRMRTIADADGNIKKIGRWGNDGDQQIKGLLKDDRREGEVRKDIGWMGPADEAYDADDSDAGDEEDWDGDEPAEEDEDEGGW